MNGRSSARPFQLQHNIQLDDVSVRSGLVTGTGRRTGRVAVCPRTESPTGRRACRRLISENSVYGALLIVSMLVPSCRHESRTVAPVGICNHRLGPLTIAVAPAVNLSGSTAIDPERFADLMASELMLVDGITVVPVSRVLAALGSEGRRGVESPAHAMSLLDRLGVDAILVFAVTEYDPYNPPSIGITTQLYGQRPGAGGVEAHVEPTAGHESGGEAGTQARAGLLAQTQRSYHASHERVVQELRGFAASRGGDSSPYGWRRFTVSQAEFIRYCCHATLRSLFGGAMTEGAEVHGQAAG